MTYTIPSYTVRPGSVYQPPGGVPGYIKQNARALYAAGLGAAFDSTKLLDQSPLHLGTRRAGQQGRDYTGDGIDDEVNYGDIGTAIWFSGWVRLNSDNQCLFSLSNDTNTNVIVAAGVLTAGATLTLSGIKVDNVSKTASESGVLLNDNLYHFLSCGIGDGLGGSSTADDVRFFTDGTNHGSVSGFDWRLYSTTPTADELTEAYSGTGARNIASMSKYALWDKMDTQSGVTSYDSSGNGLTGTLTNITAANFHTTQDVYSFQNQVGYAQRIYFNGVDSFVNGLSIDATDCEFYLQMNVAFPLSQGNSPINSLRIGTNFVRLAIGGTAYNWTPTFNPASKIWKYRFKRTGDDVEFFLDDVSYGVLTVSGNITYDKLGQITSAYYVGTAFNFKEGGVLKYKGYGNTDADWTDQIGSDNGTVNGSPSILCLPRDESDPTNDVLGNPLTYTDIRPNDAALINSSCLTADGTLYIAAAHLAGTETVVRSGGTSTPSISAGRIDFTAGTCWDLLLSDGTYYPLADSWGTPISNAAVDGDDGVLTNATLANAWGATQDEFNYNFLNDFSLYEHASTAAIRVPFVNGSPRSFAPPTGYTLTAHYLVGNFPRPAETEINFNPDSTPEMGGQLGSYTAPAAHAFGDDMDPGATDQGFARQTSSKEDRFAIFAEPQTGGNLTTIERWTT
jgi:hypothetical protein